MDYSGLKNTAIAQIADKGRDVTFIYTTQGAYSAASDGFTGKTSSTQTVKMLITNFKRKDRDAELVKSGFRLGLLANDALTRAPKTNDQVSDGGETYTVHQVEEIKPGDTVLLYKLILGR